MYSKFQYDSLPLKAIHLDYKNPRIVTQLPLTTQKAVVKYLFEHDDLLGFIKKIASEGKNAGAERPYVVKNESAAKYTVIEGNTRIAAYKVLTGQLEAPDDFASLIPKISAATLKKLESVDCSIAPNRDSLLPIMASAHFGLGDKSKWGYLGSRKAVFDEWQSGKTILQVAKAFNQSKGDIADLIIEYQLYLKALALTWTKQEKEILLDPAVKFNPPVRFLQTSGHKLKMGIEYDKANLKVVFTESDTESKFKHLILKLVINPEAKLGATAGYEDVFKSFKAATSVTTPASTTTSTTKDGNSVAGGNPSTAAPSSGPTTSSTPTASPRKANTLFNYVPKAGSPLITQLMKEAKDLNCKTFPASGSSLLRTIIEALCKQMIADQNANKDGKSHDLASAVGVCLSSAVKLSADEARILNEFKKAHLDYLNLAAHSTIIPNYTRLMSVRDCVDQFVKGRM